MVQIFGICIPAASDTDVLLNFVANIRMNVALVVMLIVMATMVTAAMVKDVIKDFFEQDKVKKWFHIFSNANLGQNILQLHE